MSSEIAQQNMTLDQLNDEKARTYYGAVIFIGVLMLPGIIGNSHVLHIYITKYPNNNTRVFVIFLAAIDLLACVAVFPPAMVNYLYPLTLYMDAGCKLFTYVASTLASGEGLTLLAIAVERYRKICKPFKPQFTVKHAKMICAGILVLSSVSTSPVFYLFGSTDRPTRFPNITGNGCNVRLELRRTLLERFYNGLTLFMSLSICTVLIVLYTLIGRRIWRHQAKMNDMQKNTRVSDQYQPGRETNKAGNSENNEITRTTNGVSGFEAKQVNDQPLEQEMKICSNQKCNTEPEVLADQSQGREIKTISNEISEINPHQTTNQSQSRTIQTTSNRNPQSVNQNKGVNRKHSQDNEGESRAIRTLHKSLKRKRGVLTKNETEKFQQMKKPIYMFMWITLFYFISYIPYPTLLLVRTFQVDWFNNLDYSGLVVFHLVVSFIFLNNVVNSLIYTIFDSKYRSEIKTFYKTLYERLFRRR